MSEGAVGAGEEQSGTPVQVGGGDEGRGAWQTLVSSLPEGLQSDPNIQRHQSFEALAHEYAHLVPAIGKKGVLLPKGDDPQDVHRFLKELGRPDDPNGYDRGDFTPPDGMPWDSATEEKLTKLMHDSGITQGQYEKLLRGYAELQQEMFTSVMAEADQDHERQVGELRKELGAGYERTVNLASRAMQKVFGANAEVLLQSRLADGTALGNNPDFIRGMIQISKMYGEDQLVSDSLSRGPMAMGPAEARQKIQEKYADKGFMSVYTNPKDPGHAAANAEMDSLYAQASAGGE